MSTALMCDRIRKEGHSVKVTDYTKDKCTIIGVRKDNGDSIKVEFTMEDAQLAGLTQNDNWRKYPKAMLYNRAMSTLARMLFPDVVGNCYSEDEKREIETSSFGQRREEPKQEVIETIEIDPHDYTAEFYILIADDKQAESLLLERFSCATVDDIPVKELERCVSWLKDRKERREKEHAFERTA
jgi:hypothetical protein